MSNVSQARSNAKSEKMRTMARVNDGILVIRNTTVFKSRDGEEPNNDDGSRMLV